MTEVDLLTLERWKDELILAAFMFEMQRDNLKYEVWNSLMQFARILAMYVENAAQEK